MKAARLVLMAVIAVYSLLAAESIALPPLVFLLLAFAFYVAIVTLAILSLERTPTP